MKRLRGKRRRSQEKHRDNEDNLYVSYPTTLTQPTDEVDFPTLFVGNSFCQLAKFPASIMAAVKELLTYENVEIEKEIQSCYNMIRYAKSKNKKRMVYAMRKKLEKLENERIVCWLRGGAFPTGHLPMVKDLLKELNYHDFEVEDRRNPPSNFVTLRWRNKPFDPRYYQREMIDLAPRCERGVFESAVGTGKSLIMEYIIKNLGVHTLIVVPSNPLLEQIYRDVLLCFGHTKVSKVDSVKVKRGTKLNPIRIVTIHTLSALKKSGLLREVLKDVDMLMVDEIHHAGANSYTELLEDFDSIYYRFGFTGTFLRNDSKTLDMWGFLSNRLYHYPPWKATEEGFLTPIEMQIEELPGKGNKDYQKEYDANYCGGQALLGAILRRVSNIPESDQILILVDRKDKSGKIIHELLTQKGVDNRYISGDDKKDYIADSIEDFNKKKIRVLIGSTVIGEGVDIHSTQHLILANGGKSPIKLVQAIGRLARLHEGKEIGYLYDFYFEETNYMAKHCQQRVDVFLNHFAGEVKWLSET